MLFDAFGGVSSALLVILGAAAMGAVGCGPTVFVTEDDAGPASAGAGGSANGGGSAHGGAVGQGGAGGAEGSGAGGEGSTGSGGSLCDGDCGVINTPQCYEAVCNEGSYPGPVGVCVVVYEADFTPCDDGKACSVDDACLAGICVGDETSCN
jgi:hypothetical protein